MAGEPINIGFHQELPTPATILDKRKRIPKGQSKIDNAEKLATRRRKTQHNMCWIPLHTQTSTNKKKTLAVYSMQQTRQYTFTLIN